jgi:exopolysaccharide biosynthesis protein
VKTFLLAVLLLAGTSAPDGPLPSSSLRVRDGDRWATWWRSDQAPEKWIGNAALARRIRWRSAQPGVAWGELSLAGDGEAWRTQLLVARLDPKLLRLELDTGFTNQRAALSVERIARDAAKHAVFGVNAGQFSQALPWGWVVLDGRQFLPPAHGPLASTVILDSLGSILILHGDSIAPTRRRSAKWAFQSYPTLMMNGRVPTALQASDRGVDVGHRDARLAIGRFEDGEIVVAMTRFAAFGGTLQRLPFGLTTPEMAAVMGALDARDAVMLDGGISAQMMIRERLGRPRVWAGLRAVPLALIARQR